MSHTVKIKTEFKNWDTLVKTFNQLKWTVKEKAKLLRTYPSDPAKGTLYDFIAVNPDQCGYDVGIKVSEEGDISLHCDFYGGTIAKTLGNQMSTLKKEYVINVTKENFEDVQILEMLADGSIILEADDGL